MARAIPEDQLRAAADAYRKEGNNGYRLLGLKRTTFNSRVGMAVDRGLVTRDERRSLAPPAVAGATVDETAILRDQVRTLRAQIAAGRRESLTDEYVRSNVIGVPTLFCSDWHWGEVVDPRQINGVNEFNIEIAHRRARRTVETAITLLTDHMVDPKYPGIVFALGGDMMSGDIHEELSNTNELPVMPALVDLFGVLTWCIERLADRFGRVFVPCVTGNHGRNTHKPRAKQRNFSNFDWLLYTFLAKRFENDARVQFLIPDGTDAHWRIYDVRYCLTHGDQFRGGDGMIGALGPIIRGDHKKRSRNGQVDLGYDVLLLGHWHQLIQLQRLIVNGSLKGYDEYAASGNFGFERPQQALWITHPEHGITFSMPVHCDDAPAVKQREWLSWQA